jgi:hypothetical protein
MDVEEWGEEEEGSEEEKKGKGRRQDRISGRFKIWEGKNYWPPDYGIP